MLKYLRSMLRFLKNCFEHSCIIRTVGDSSEALPLNHKALAILCFSLNYIDQTLKLNLEILF